MRMGMPEPTARLAREAFQEIADAAQSLLGEYGMQSRSTLDRGCVEVVLWNRDTFIRCTWDPRDKFLYSVGPTIGGEPPRRSHDSCRTTPRMEYGEAVIRTLKGVRVTDDLGIALARGRHSPKEGLKAIQVLAHELLAGDWSRREDLEQIADAI